MVIDVTGALRALDHGEFLPYFQPLVRLRTGQIAGFEVLARRKHPKADMFPPDTFIPLTEKDGWIGALTHEILRKAFNVRALDTRVAAAPRQRISIGGWWEEGKMPR